MTRMAMWTERDIPDQSGRTVVVTGANSGIGLRTAQVLGQAGARVILACRSAERGDAARATVGGNAELVLLDLADLTSVRTAADTIRERTGDQLHTLINNAGVMFTPHQRTADGFEAQLGTNHYGHAALTWRLMPALRATPGARVVTVSSMFAKFTGINLADLNFEHRRYSSVIAYCQAKLANLLFALELDRRLTAAGGEVRSVAAHPGYTASALGANSAHTWPGILGDFLTGAYALGDRFIAQPVQGGALPTLYAATAPDARGGEYYGPSGLGEMRGAPRRVNPPKAALDPTVAAKLWELTAELTRVTPDPA